MSPLRITLGSSPSVPTILSRNPVVRKTGVGVIIQYVEQQVTVLGTIGTTHFYRPVVKRISRKATNFVLKVRFLPGLPF